MDIIQGLIETRNPGRSGWRIVNNGGAFGLYNNNTSNVLFSILNNGVLGISSNIPTTFINSYSGVNIVSTYSSNSSNSSNSSSSSSSSGTGSSSQWTTVSGVAGSGAKIYYNDGNIGVGTIDPVAPLHIYNNTITAVLPTEIVVAGATSATISGTTDRVVSFPYSGSATTKDYTFTTTENLICDILIVGGGGAGGMQIGAGGGGGAVLYGTNINIPIGNYTIKVGKGAVPGEVRGGSSEAFGATLLGGGSVVNAVWATTNNAANGYSGGSGGGGKGVQAGFSGGSGGTVGTSTKGTILNTSTLYNGNVGGAGQSQSSGVSSGGGGGAGGVGGFGPRAESGGDGGIGIPINITGTEYYWAAGGGGGCHEGIPGNGGLGGGGAGSVKRSNGILGSIGNFTGDVGGSGYGIASGKNAGNGTGSGGGGVHAGDNVGGNGGSGIIIIRYRRQTQPSVSNTRLLLDATTTGAASIEFRRGVGSDIQNDFRIINDSNPASGIIKLQVENSAQIYSDATANLAWFSSNESIIYKNTTMNGRVGIGTTYNMARSLDVAGDANISGIFTTSNLSVSGSATIANSSTSNVSLTIQNGLSPPMPNIFTVVPLPNEIVVAGTTTGIIGADRFISFPYSGSATTKDYTFTTTENLICDILMIGGGGAGGFDRAGGGGAGSCIIALSQTLGVGTYNIKVGSGQPVISNNTTSGTGGDSEIFLNSSILYRAKGGGNGGAAAVNNATAGGCGGGAGSQGPFNGGSATNLNYIAGNLVNANTTTTTYANLGFKGGDQLVGWNGSNGDQLDGAGGGGIGGAGVNHNVGEINGTAGGASLDRVVINTSTYIFKDYFAGGGTLGVNGFIGGGGGGGNCNGGVVGNGGGGGAGNGGGVSATSNTGSGGGGGASGTGSGGAGGSGIVIIRYRKPSSDIINETISGIVGTADRYMIFPYSGTGATKDYSITTTENLGCDILIVAGGGAGGTYIAGGGGAGGVLYIQNATISAGTYNILVGSGGNRLSGSTVPTIANNNGKSSKAFGIEVFGGGYGGSGMWAYPPNYIANNGADGGSGGAGGSYNSGRATTVGGNKILPSYTNNVLLNGTYNYYGGSGGDGKVIGFQGGGSGGGGAGGIKPTSSLSSYDGADGIEINITGVNYFWGGGGGGCIQDNLKAGNGGKGGGGGGSGGNYTGDSVGIGGIGGITLGQDGDLNGDGNPTAGDGGPGTGGGGGATANVETTPLPVSGAGGSGIIIVRYRKLPNEIVVAGTTSTIVGTTDRCISFPYSGSATTKDYTFTTTEALNCDILIVGGGGGGACFGGGGGGGQVLYTTNLTISSSSALSIQVGRGGITTQPLTVAENGISSTLTIGGITYTANGGGGGAGRDRSNYGSFRPAGGTGGSGGGGQAPDSSPDGPGGISNKTSYSGWISNGNAGGIGTGLHYGGGGGGAGAIGGNAVNLTSGGIGGVGVNLGSTFTTTVGASGWFGGGGGGVTYQPGTAGTGGTGGGGAGATWSPNVPNGVNGTANTGGGGGSSGLKSSDYLPGIGGAGGSGIVIIRYRLPITLTSTSLELTLPSSTSITEPQTFNVESIYPPYRYFTYNDTNGSYTVQNGSIEAGNLTNFSYTYSYNDSANTQGNNEQTSSTFKNTYGMGLYKFSVGGTQTADGRSSGLFIYALSSDYSLSTSGNRPAVNIDDNQAALPNGPGWYVGTGWSNSTTYNSSYYYNTTFQGAWIKIEMPVGIVFSSFKILGGFQKYRSPKAFKIYGSNTNTTTASDWTLLHTETNYTYNAGGDFGVKQTVPNNLMFKNYLMVVSEQHTYDGGLLVFQGWYIYGKEKLEPVVINSDYKYLSFTHSGGTETQTSYTVNFPESTLCDILVVGGGGGGAGTVGGGGGAGALIFAKNAILSNGTYTISVGSGGIGGASQSSPVLIATKGNSSSISKDGINITAEGGGASGRADGNQNGGSGGGGDYWEGNETAGTSTSYTSTAFGASIVKYGNNGANAYNTSPVNGGGGGGAGSSALKATSTNLFSNGGSGLHQVVIDGITINFAIIFGTNIAQVGGVLSNGNLYYGGGGGAGGQDQATGGTGGIGGGGNGGPGSSGTVPPYIPIHGSNGLPNTGGGGGGGSNHPSSGGNGGSGIVIIRYKSTKSGNQTYKVGNFNGEFKIISSVSNTDTEYMKITTAGAITNPTGTASWNTGSDRRIKENIERASYDKCFENINRLELNRFNYISGFNTVNRDRTQLGFIAQEVQDIFPKAISSQGYYSNTMNIPDLLSIDVSQINYSLYGAVKKLIEINNEKDAQLKTLDDELKNLETILNIVPESTTSNIATVTATSNIVVEGTTSNIVEDIATASSNIIVDSSTENI